MFALITSTTSSRDSTRTGRPSIAKLPQRRQQVAIKVGNRIDRDVVGAGDGDVDDLRCPSLSRRAAALRDAGKRAREVGSSRPDRHQPVEGHDRQRRILASLVAVFLVRAAGSAQRIDDSLDAERLRLQKADLFGLHVAGFADPAAVDCLHVLHAGRQTRALLRRCRRSTVVVVLVVGLRDEVAVLRARDLRACLSRAIRRRSHRRAACSLLPPESAPARTSAAAA